jgi:hypothetical protein
MNVSLCVITGNNNSYIYNGYIKRDRNKKGGKKERKKVEIIK